MGSSTIDILMFGTSQNLLNENVKDPTTVPNQDTQGIWMGECLEDPGLTLVVIGTKRRPAVDVTDSTSGSFLSRISRWNGSPIVLRFHSQGATAH